MRFLIATYCILLCTMHSQTGFAQSPTTQYFTIPLNDLNAFRDPGKNWVLASDASTDLTVSGEMKPVKGNGVLVNSILKNNNTHLITKEEFGDLELELDFMMDKNSNSGVYLLGRYEIQLFDSWTKLNTKFDDCGGIYQRWDENRKEEKGYEGQAPLMNVSKAPGLWQHLKLKFLAPKFDGNGIKIANARFEEVYLNGILVQQQMDVTGPTRSAIFDNEKPTGPLMLQGDHGAVAFRNIRYRLLQNPTIKLKPDSRVSNPIIVNPEAKPYLFRSFMNFNKKKLTHIISVGNPNQVNYAYDLSQGAIFQIWRGEFLDVTQLWLDRGEPQLANPLGSVTSLTDAPFIAILSDDKTSWPDSIDFEDIQIKGYLLDNQRTPTFKYAVKGIDVTDKITSQNNGESLLRELNILNPPANLYCRIASASTIEHIRGDLYGINDKSYYIRVNKSLKPIIRKSQNGQEIIVRYETTVPLTYSIIW